SISGSTSPARNSFTASRSSSASGRSRMLDPIQQLVLHLRREAAENRELDAPVEPVQVPARLREAADCPLDVAEDLPDVELVQGQLAAGELLIPPQIRLDFADAAEPQIVGAEAPRADERPRHVLRGVGEMRELPVEDGDEPLLVDDE